MGYREFCYTCCGSFNNLSWLLLSVHNSCIQNLLQISFPVTITVFIGQQHTTPHSGIPKALSKHHRSQQLEITWLFVVLCVPSITGISFPVDWDSHCSVQRAQSDNF